MGRTADSSADDLPRERLRKTGSVEHVTDADLLALLFRTGNRRKDVFTVTRELLNTYSLEQLSIMRLEEFQETGISELKASVLMAAFELNRRLERSLQQERRSLNDSSSVFLSVLPWFRDTPYEKVIVVFVTTKNAPIATEIMAEGTLESAPIDLRKILKRALLLHASGFFLIHNHPSGDPTPSRDDHEVTSRCAAAAEVLGIRFLDHLIIGRTSYFSFHDEDLL